MASPQSAFRIKQFEYIKDRIYGGCAAFIGYSRGGYERGMGGGAAANAHSGGAGAPGGEGSGRRHQPHQRALVEAGWDRSIQRNLSALPAVQWPGPTAPGGLQTIPDDGVR